MHKISGLGYNIAAVYTVTKEADIPLSREFCLTLFGDPVNTIIQMTNVGLTVTRPGGQVQKMLILGPSKLEVTTGTITETAEAFAKVHKTLIDTKYPMKINAYGLNFFFDLALDGLAGSDPSKWMADRFISKAIPKASPWIPMHASVTFGLTHPEGARREVQIGPSATKQGCLGAYVNNHYEITKDVELGNRTWLLKELEEGYNKSTEFVCNLLE